MKKHAKLKGLRNQCDLSQKKVGEQLGITAQAYSSKENGKTQFTYDAKIPTLEELMQLIQSYGDKNIVFALVDFRDLNASYTTSALITIPAPPP